MSESIEFATAMDAIAKMEDIMSTISHKWNQLSADAQKYVMLRYAHVTFAYLSKERHDIHLKINAEINTRTLCVELDHIRFRLSVDDRKIIDLSNLIWDAMPVIPDSSWSISLDGKNANLRFECTYAWNSLHEVYRVAADAALSWSAAPTPKNILCTYSIIPITDDQLEYVSEDDEETPVWYI